MRRLILALAFVSIVANLESCKRKKKQQVEYVDEGSGQLASTINIADPRTTIQLVRGFHDLENSAWRWTMGKFAVSLRPPATPPGKSTNLVLKFSIPATVLAKHKSIVISATVSGVPLDSATFASEGEQEYRRKVPANALQDDMVPVEFSLDKFFAAGTLDLRELGIVVSVIGLEIAP